MCAGGYQQRHIFLFMLALPIMLEDCSVQACRSGTGSQCEKAPFVPGHNLAGEGFDVVRMRRTGAYVINVKAHLADNHTCTLCPNRFQKGEVKSWNLLLNLHTLYQPQVHSFTLFFSVLSCIFPPPQLPIFSSTTCIPLHFLPFICSTDSETPSFSAWLASLQPLL